MRHYLRSLPKRRLVVNYIGGLGYYGWLIAWLLVVAQLGVQAAQFLLPPSSSQVQDVPMTSDAPQASSLPEVGVVWNLAAVLLIGVAIICVLVMPYYVGWLTKKLPRWVVKQTDYSLSLHVLYCVKLIGCGVTILISTALLFAPYESGLTNALYVTTLAILFASLVCFWLQYKIATLWHIPERDVF